MIKIRKSLMKINSWFKQIRKIPIVFLKNKLHLKKVKCK